MELSINNLKNKSVEIFNLINQKKTDYRNIVSYEKRCNESNRLRIKYINCVPIIVESKDLVVKKNKFLVHMSSSTSNVIYNIRKQLEINPEKAIFIFCDNKLLNLTQTIGNVYENYLFNNKIKNGDDLFLYFELKEETAFG